MKELIEDLLEFAEECHYYIPANQKDRLDRDHELAGLKARCSAEPRLPEGYRFEWSRTDLFVIRDDVGLQLWCCRVGRDESTDYISTDASCIRRGDPIEVFLEIIPAALAEYRKRYPQVELDG